MKFYKRFMGDIQAKTGHLSLAEFGAYDRLLDHCYSTEDPLPADIDSCCRIARATSSAERKAVERVLREFFDLTEQGYVQHRVLEMLADAQPKIAANQRNGKLGGRPRKVPQALPGASQEKPTGFSKETQSEPNDNLSQSQSQSSGIPPVVAKDQDPLAHTARADENGDFLGPKPPESPPAAAAVPIDRIIPAQVAFAMRKVGIDKVSASNQKLLTLIAAGATVDEFVEAAKKAVKGGKGFAYALGVVEGERREAAAMASQLHKGPLPPKPAAQGETFRERERRLAAEEVAKWSPRIAAIPGGQPIEHPRNIIDMEPPYALAHRSS